MVKRDGSKDYNMNKEGTVTEFQYNFKYIITVKDGHKDRS